MTRRLGLDKCLSTRGSYSLSFSLDGGILTVERLSYEPWWRKILLTGLFFIPFLGFLLSTLYCIYAIFAGLEYAANCLEVLTLMILISVICFTGIPSINTLYSSKVIFGSGQFSFIGAFISRKSRLANKKAGLVLEIYDSPRGSLLKGEIIIRRKGKFPPWNIHVPLFQTITYPSKEIANKNACMIKEFISENAHLLFSEIIIEQ